MTNKKDWYITAYLQEPDEGKEVYDYDLVGKNGHVKANLAGCIESEVNLIGAAPDLLEAARMGLYALQNFYNAGQHSPAVIKLQNAIAKAEGKIND